MRRVFISVNIEPGPGIMGVYKDFKENLINEPVKWVRPENFHITLAFLGDLAEERISSLSDKLQKVSVLWKPFTIELSGVGVFRNIRNPSVIWIGIKPSIPLNNLKYQVGEILLEEGLPVESGDFSPHLTFARLKKKKYLKEIEQLVKKYENKEFESQRIDSFEFNQSILKPGGPVYKPVGVYPFISA